MRQRKGRRFLGSFLLGLLLLGLFLLVPGQGWADEGPQKLSEKEISRYIRWVLDRYKGAPEPPPEWGSSMASGDLVQARRAAGRCNDFGFALYRSLAKRGDGNILLAPYPLWREIFRSEEEGGAQSPYLGESGDFHALEKILESTPLEAASVDMELSRDSSPQDGRTSLFSFEGNWEFPFNPYSLHAHWGSNRYTISFDRGEGKIEETPVLIIKQRAWYYEDHRMQALRYPYYKRYYTFLIMVPKKEGDLGEMEGELSQEKLQALFGKMEEKNLVIRLPHFSATLTYPDLSPLYAALGLSPEEARGLPRSQSNRFGVALGDTSRSVSTSGWGTAPLVLNSPGFRFDSSVPPGSPDLPCQSRDFWKESVQKSNAIAASYHMMEDRFFPSRPLIYGVVHLPTGMVMLLGRYAGEEEGENLRILRTPIPSCQGFEAPYRVLINMNKWL